MARQEWREGIGWLPHSRIDPATAEASLGCAISAIKVQRAPCERSGDLLAAGYEDGNFKLFGQETF